MASLPATVPFLFVSWRGGSSTDIAGTSTARRPHLNADNFLNAYAESLGGPRGKQAHVFHDGGSSGGLLPAIPQASGKPRATGHARSSSERNLLARAAQFL